MKIEADDWHFKPSENDMLVLDLFLSNGQHAILHVSPMKNPHAPHGQTPEMVVYCEFPGEKPVENGCVARWVTRPPDRNCPWSGVQISPALAQQIREKLGYVEEMTTAKAA